MPNPDLEIRGGGGDHPDPPLDKGGARSPKNGFPLFGPQFGLKIKGEGGGAGPSPGPATD